MIFEYDKQQLDIILADFYKITKLSVSIWDSDFNQLGFYPQETPPFCKLIKSKKQGIELCRESDLKILKQSEQARKPVTHICHAGLCDTAVPIMYEEQILGYFMFGQIKYSNTPMDEEKIAKLCTSLKINKKRLTAYFKNIPITEQDYIDSASRILYASTSYLWLSKIIKINKSHLPSQIDLYINQHIREKLSVTDICEKLYISKNKLYSTLKKNFNCTFSGYVLKKRISLATVLIESTDDPISEIAEKTGMNDYNYFIKVFKKQKGMTPLAYRKAHSKILSAE